MTQPADNAHITQRLETGRQCLEALATIAAQLENAKEGLARSHYLTDDLDKLPPQLRKLWESLDKGVSSLPQKELLQELGQLERLLTLRLSNLLPLIDDICDADEHGSAIELGNARQQIAELARIASTALAIRLLAKRRNIDVPPADLPVNSSVLRDRAQRVKQVERKQKLAVINQIKDMVKATTEMLNTPGLDGNMRKMLKNVLHDLQSNAKHLGNGGSFSTLPSPIESVEMQGDSDNAASATSSIQSLDHDRLVLKKSELDELRVAPPPPKIELPKPEVVSRATVVPPTPAAVHKSSPKVAAPSPAKSTAPPNSVGRLWRKLNVWMHAPMGVTWSQADAMLRAKESSDSTRQQSPNQKAD